MSARPSPRPAGARAAPPSRPAEIAERLEGALARSPAAETELVWLEARHGLARLGGGRPEVESRGERTVLVRVIDHGRVGSHRTGGADPGDLDNAVRAAIAQSRARQPLPGLPHLPTDDGALPELPRLRDRAVARLDGRAVEKLIAPLRRRPERARLRWSDARVAVFSSRGLRRGASVTGVELAVRCGDRPGCGSATDAARSLARLRPQAVFERARRRHGDGEPGEPPAEPGGMVLSAEATARLCDLINRKAFSAAAYSEGASLLREHLGVQVFDRAFELKDDATDAAGLPFPFDLEGTPKRPVALIEHGTPRTPALDQRRAAEFGLPPTAHALGGADARAENLFLTPGGQEDAELLGGADGGLWVGRLGALECFEPTRLQIRAVLSGVRRIRDGALAEPLPDLVWESSLLRAFSSLDGIGVRPTRLLGLDGYLGGISAPAVGIRVPGAEVVGVAAD